LELQIDTSTRYASVGLSIEGKSLVDIAWRSERNHSVELVPAINRAFEQAGARITDLDAVFTVSGPGAFSALRVGMSTAKAIASTRGIPLVTVGTLDVEIQPFRVLDLPICAIASAGRNRLYVGRTVEGSDEIATEVQAVAEFLDHVSDGILYCGEAVLELADQMESRVGASALVIRSVPPTRRASTTAYIGYQKLVRGETVDPSSAEPTYLRSSQIASAARRWGSGN
jgi:tRNA threonylcarbamoyladenosine biosynthesis protein TsaB